MFYNHFHFETVWCIKVYPEIFYILPVKRHLSLNMDEFGTAFIHRTWWKWCHGGNDSIFWVQSISALYLLKHTCLEPNYDEMRSSRDIRGPCGYNSSWAPRLQTGGLSTMWMRHLDFPAMSNLKMTLSSTSLQLHLLWEASSKNCLADSRQHIEIL